MVRCALCAPGGAMRNSILVLIAIALTSKADAASPNACEKLGEIFHASFDCCGSGQGTNRCGGIANAYSAAGCGTLSCSTVIVVDGFTITLSADRTSLSVCKPQVSSDSNFALFYPTG